MSATAGSRKSVRTSVSQARAAATRQRLIDAAVEVFTEKGYLSAVLTDITSRAAVTTGAFYHHFASKEELAMVIVEQGWSKVSAEVTRSLNSASPGLERVIAMTFRVSELMKRDKSVSMANRLCQTFGQLSVDGRASLHAHVNRFIHRVADALSDVELRDGINPVKAASLVWIALHGCQLLADALIDSPSHAEYLRLSWLAGLPAMVSPAALPHYERFTAHIAGQYIEPDCDGLDSAVADAAMRQPA